MHHEKNSCMLVNNLFMASTMAVFFFFSFVLVSITKTNSYCACLPKVLLGYPNYHLNKINGNMNDRSKIIQGCRETVFFFQATNTGGHPSSLQCQICNN